MMSGEAIRLTTVAQTYENYPEKMDKGDSSDNTPYSSSPPH